MKHAFLIMAHDNFELLKFLIELLDNEDCDIYVHVDKKCIAPELHAEKSRLFVASKIDVRWGDFSQVQAMMFLFSWSFNNSESVKYDYFHLISGVDLPIKPLKDFFEYINKNNGKEFVKLEQSDGKIIPERVTKWHLFTRYYKSTFLIRNIFKVVRFIPEQFLNLFFKRSDLGQIYKGSQWLSLTYSAVDFLIQREDFINKRFKFCCCPDEEFILTLLCNSPFKDKVVNDNLRLIDFERSPNGASPYTWTTSESDLKILSESGAFFARKFSEKNLDVLKKQINLLCNRIQ